MNILGIETSCDETAASVVCDGREILSSVVSTQIPFHRPFSGVVPELASRAHVLTINRVIEKAMQKAGFHEFSAKGRNGKLDAIAVTVGPGLAGSLLVGRMAAESLGWAMKVPVVGVNHMEGHLLSPLLLDPSLKPPFLGLIASGGHTELVFAPQWGRYYLIGRTRDDAAGEAFDKVAKMMNLGYPGGPVIDRMAKSVVRERYPFPRPWLTGTWDFSFSGLKTAVLYKLRERKSWPTLEKRYVCAGFQRAVIDVLVKKTMAAAAALNVKTVVVGGGVAANSLLRAEFDIYAISSKRRVVMAPPELCTDNAAMIASAGFFKLRYRVPNSKNRLKIQPQLHFPRFEHSLRAFSAALIPNPVGGSSRPN